MIHLIKLCVGVASVEELVEWRAERKARGLGRPDGLNTHRTRMMPKRRDEVLDGGSLYWVIAGQVRCRQRIIDLEAATDSEGRPCCHILMDPEVVLTVPQPKRPFQGWRYLQAKDAPADLSAGAGSEEIELAAELSKLGLI